MDCALCAAMDLKGWLYALLLYILAVLLPPIAAVVTRGFGWHAIVTCALTFILPLAYLGYIYHRGTFEVLYILYCYLLIFPGSIYTVWLTFKSTRNSSEMSLDNIVAEPKPQRLASIYQTQLGIQITPSGSTPSRVVNSAYSGKYSPMTQSGSGTVISTTPGLANKTGYYENCR